MKPSRIRLTIGLWTAVTLTASFGLSCQAEQADQTDTIYVGDTVTVTKDGIEFGLRDKPAATLAKGDTIHVTEVRGTWIGGYIVKDGKRYTGWVRRAEVELVVIAPDEVDTIVVPDIPDDPAVVAALRELKVKLELNDKGNVYTADATEATIEDSGMKHFRGLHQLVSLDLSDRPITDAGLGELGNSTVLQELYLGNTQVTDDGLAILKALPNLEVLAVSGTQVRGSGLVHLKHVPNLRVLNTADCNISDSVLAQLATLSKLEVLALNNTKISNDGLVHMKPLAKLRVLNVNGCSVDDDGLDHLTGLDKLRMLYVEQTDISQDGIDTLNLSLPSLAIFD
jgi:hypothetical protein